MYFFSSLLYLFLSFSCFLLTYRLASFSQSRWCAQSYEWSPEKLTQESFHSVFCLSLTNTEFYGSLFFYMCFRSSLHQCLKLSEMFFISFYFILTCIFFSHEVTLCHSAHLYKQQNHCDCSSLLFSLVFLFKEFQIFVFHQLSYKNFTFFLVLPSFLSLPPLCSSTSLSSL